MKHRSFIFQSEKGYSLLELTIVLALLATITGIVTISFSSISKTNASEQFIEQLKDDIYYAHMLALSRGKTISVQFRPNSHSYRVIGATNEVFLERHYSKNIKISRGSADYRIYFNPNGNIRNPGSLYIETTTEKYSLVFLLGKGRFYVKKL